MKVYALNVPNVRARPKKIFPPVSCRLYLQKINIAAEVSNDILVKLLKENKNSCL